MGRKVILDMPNYTGYMGFTEFVGSVSVKDADELAVELMTWKSIPCHLAPLPVPEPVPVPISVQEPSKEEIKPSTRRGK